MARQSLSKFRAFGHLIRSTICERDDSVRETFLHVMSISLGMPIINDLRQKMTREEKSMAELHAYRAYFLSSSDHIRYVRAVNAPDHLSARALAEVMLRQSEYAAVEVYEGWRLISRMDRTQKAA